MFDYKQKSATSGGGPTDSLGGVDLACERSAKDAARKASSKANHKL